MSAVEMLRGPDHIERRRHSGILNRPFVERRQAPRQLARPGADDPTVHCHHGREAAEGAGDKGFVGAVDVRQGKVALVRRDAVGFARVLKRAAG